MLFAAMPVFFLAEALPFCAVIEILLLLLIRPLLLLPAAMPKLSALPSKKIRAGIPVKERRVLLA